MRATYTKDNGERKDDEESRDTAFHYYSYGKKGAWERAVEQKN